MPFWDSPVFDVSQSLERDVLQVMDSHHSFLLSILNHGQNFSKVFAISSVEQTANPAKGCPAQSSIVFIPRNKWSNSTKIPSRFPETSCPSQKAPANHELAVYTTVRSTKPDADTIPDPDTGAILILYLRYNASPSCKIESDPAYKESCVPLQIADFSM